METQSEKYKSNITRDFRKFLQQELIRRCATNPQYSLRAFAKSLGIYHATLSSLLAARRPVTKATILKLAAPLNLSPQEVREFVDALNRSKSDSAQSENECYREYTMDLFAVTADWYYDAILELTHLNSFQPQAKWIAQRTGITVAEVNIAIERLFRLDLLKEVEGKWIDTSKNSTTIIDENFTNVALRKYQKKILELSAISLDEVSKQHRDHTSITVAIQKSDVKSVQSKIKEFRRELTSYLQRECVDADEVYQLSFSFFPLTKFQK